MVRVLGIIPARYGAQRFPGKPLAMIAGQPLIQRVFERARRAQSLDELVVATDDDRIRECVEGFGGKAVMTPADCPSGTDRAAAVARGSTAELIVNIQGDEPLIDPSVIDQLVAGIESAPDCGMATLARPVAAETIGANPNIVKVVIDSQGQALYFSRSLIPYPRDPAGGARTYQHLGLYAYRREFLLRFVQWAPSPLEQTEKLEQLRTLENGGRIQVIITDHDSIGVDTPADIQRVEARLATEQPASPNPSRSL